MKKMLLAGIGLGLLLLLLALGACAQNLQPQVDKLTKDNDTLTKQNQTLKELAGILPASLDNYFPPKAPAPVWLLEMFNLSGPFGGIGSDLQEGDIKGAQANYDAFKAQYTKMAGMVPEWTARFPQAPVDALGQALASGDPAKVGPAMGQVGAVCGSCHELYMVKTQQKYHWPDFRQIKVTDPLTKESLTWGEYMWGVEGAFSSALNDLQQGQLDKARQNFDAFKTRFKTLSEACSFCHATPRAYFVDASVQGMIDQAGKAFAATPPDGKTIGELAGAIGNESCAKCHWVHYPSVNAKRILEKAAEITK
ncbi:MAG: hypothetical protein HY663_02725 [Chloroflexi bacterium]|nr:hypothetical protein [Chloroflexota bacterium]